jgi:hypothetical protein
VGWIGIESEDELRGSRRDRGGYAVTEAGAGW